MLSHWLERRLGWKAVKRAWHTLAFLQLPLLLSRRISRDCVKTMRIAQTWLSRMWGRAMPATLPYV